jgi:CRISPR-associated protein Cas6
MDTESVTSLAMVDLVFPVVGFHLPTDHGYALYGAMSRLLPCLHDGSVRFGFLPITGSYIGRGMLQLDARRSHLRVRVPVNDLPRVLPLAGNGLEVMGHRVRLGVPQVEALQPAATLVSRTVAIKSKANEGSFGVEGFLQAAQRQLSELGIEGILSVPENTVAARKHSPLRRVVRVKGVQIVCYALLVEGLKPDESLRLQERGIGGRRRLGCGVFIPACVEENGHDN